MNYANVFGRTQRQFDMTMNRERITVTDFYNSDIKYDVFFRRNQRSTTPEGKVRFFYAQSTPINIGTIFILNGSTFIVTSKDGIESGIYNTSVAVKSDFIYKIKTDNGIAEIPFYVVSDKWTLSSGNTIGYVNGAVALYTGYNSILENLKVNDLFVEFGNYYKIGNTFRNNNLFYLYLEQTVKPQDNYKITYNGVSSFDMKDSTTYQLSYTVTNNDSVLAVPTITYQSSANDVATVDENGLMTMLKEGSVDITATAYGASCTTTMTITNTSAPQPENIKIKLTADDTELRMNLQDMLVCSFIDSSGNDITDSFITKLSADDFVWTCSVDSVELTNNTNVIKWSNNSAINKKMFEFVESDESYNYIDKTLICKVAVKNMSATVNIILKEGY